MPKPKKFVKIRFLAIFASVLFLVVLFLSQRLLPLTQHNVAYTYDQGRDFLQAAEVVDKRNLTFIGPTTGIIGLYHGAWWYYVLSIPYLLFRGEPMGFYYFNLGVQLLYFLGLVLFLTFESGLLMALFIGILVATAPYFIFTSLFVGNNIMAVPNFLLLSISLFYLLKQGSKSPWWLLFINGTALGFASEFELSLGIFLIPSLVLTVLFFKPLRQTILRWPNLVIYLCGLGLAFVPRLLFELKHNFSQTKVLLNFLLQPKLYNPKPYLDVVRDRLGLFEGYYASLFNHPLWLWIISLLVLAVIIRLFWQRKLSLSFWVYSFLITCLFLFSTLYKDNFWGNYYEGIHYLMVMTLAVVIMATKNYSWHKVSLGLLSIGLLILPVINSFQPKPSQLAGLMAHEKAIEYLYSAADKKFCVDIYTPPAIPYTYRYLFYHQSLVHKQPLPIEAWQNNQCWYILEHDDYADRKAAWIKSRIPSEAKLVRSKRIADIDIQLWQK